MQLSPIGEGIWTYQVRIIGNKQKAGLGIRRLGHNFLICLSYYKMSFLVW